MKSQTAYLTYITLAFLVSRTKGSTETKEASNWDGLNTAQVDELKDEVLQRVLTPEDNILQSQVKRKLVNYLVDTTIENYEGESQWPRQEDASEAPENSEIINGVRRILQNVFTGNIVGVIQESVSIRSPGAVQTIFADVMGAIFGSNAVKGAGTIGLPQPQNGTLNATTPNANSTNSGQTSKVRTTAVPTATASDNDEEDDENDDY